MRDVARELTWNLRGGFSGQRTVEVHSTFDITRLNDTTTGDITFGPVLVR